MRKLLFVLAALTSYFVFVVPASASPPKGSWGSIEICKDSGTPAVTGTFAFTIGKVWNDDQLVWDMKTINVNVGECSTVRDVFALDGVVQVNELKVDFTAVSAIHTSQPGAKDAALESADLTHRSAVVDITASESDSMATIVHFTNIQDPDPGFYKVCKEQVDGAGLDGQSFAFHVDGGMGYAADLSVQVGSCSAVQTAPGGYVTVHELGAATFVTDISGRGVERHPDLASASTRLDIVPNGTIADLSEATFTNDSVQLKICKKVENRSLVGTKYSFGTSPSPLATDSQNGNGTAYSVTGGDPANCVLAGRYRAGESVSVTEAPSVGQALDYAYLSDHREFSASSGNDFVGNTETFTMGSGETILTFVNKLADPGQFEVCKLGVGSGNVTFSIAGPRGTAPEITQGVDSVSVPVGGCSLVQGKYPYAGIQTITEMKQAGFAPVSIAVADLDRLVAGSINLAAGSVSAFIGSDDMTVATFTNAAVVPVPPVVTPPADTPAAPAAPAVAAGQSVVASIASLPGSVTKVTKPATVRKASVVTARLLTTKVGKALQVKVSSPNKTATIRITLLKKAGKTVKVVNRTVQTNKLVRVQNLAIAKTIVAVRVAVIR